MCKHFKNNILESNMVLHHNLLGHLYAFSNQGVFKNLNNSTIGLYEVKKRYHDDRQLELEKMATQIEDMISVEMCIDKDKPSKMVARVERFILPALDVVHDM